MSIKDIVFITDGGRPCAAGAHWTAAMATALGAELLGLCQVASPDPTPAECYAIGAGVVTAVMTEMDHRTQVAVATSRQSFEDGLKGWSGKSGWRTSVAGESVESLSRGVRCFDLAVVPHYGPATRRLAEQVTLLAGTPCLLLPERMTVWKPLERIMVAWDGSREARRALDAAIPFMRQAGEVRLVTIGAGMLPASEEDKTWGVLAHLRRHGVTAELHVIAETATDAGSVLIDQATVFGADLVAMGAYCHSRTAEVVFGGVTRTLLDRASVPLLVVH